MRVLMRIAHERGLFVEFDRDMGEWLRGYYDHDARTITLNAWLDELQRPYTLAHELGHAWHGHTFDGDDPHGDPEAERLADEHAASLLIDPAKYARAEKLRGPHPGALADELGVHQDVVTIFQSVLRRVPPVAYATPWGRAPWLRNQNRGIA
jgi:Zn-dependent peptidase ImmA (M78 family)